MSAQESQTEGGVSVRSNPSPLWRGIIRELFFVFLALVAFYWASGHLAPLFLDRSLPSDWGQRGWPLAASVTYWDETSVSGDNTTSFNFFSLVFDILFFYGFLRGVIFALKKIVPDHWPYVKMAMLCGMALLILYYLFLIFIIEKPASVQSGVLVPMQVGR